MLLRAATAAASMAIARPEAIGDAPARRPQRSRGWRRGEFVVSRGMGESPGEESRPAAIAAQAIEAKPSSGQITPLRGHVVAYETANGDWRGTIGGSTGVQFFQSNLSNPSRCHAPRPAIVLLGQEAQMFSLNQTDRDEAPTW